MSDPDQPERGADEFDVATFVDEQSSLFVLAGAAAALAVYLFVSAESATALRDEPMAYVAVAAAFALSLIALAAVYSQLAAELGGWSELYRAHLDLEHPLLTAFTGFAAVLVVSLFSVLTDPSTPFLVLMIAGVAAAVGLVAHLAYLLLRRVPATPAWRLGSVFVAGSVTFLLARLLRRVLLLGFRARPVSSLRLDDPVQVATVALGAVQNAAGLGVLVVLVAVPLVVLGALGESDDGTESEGATPQD